MCLSVAHACFIMTQSDYSRLRRAVADPGWKPSLFPPEHLELSSIFTEETGFVVNLASGWRESTSLTFVARLQFHPLPLIR